MLYPFSGQDFSHLGYDDYISVLSVVGTEYLNKDPKLAFDIYDKKRKETEDKDKRDKEWLNLMLTR